MKYILAALLCTALLCGRASAAEAVEPQQREQFGLDGVENSARVLLDDTELSLEKSWEENLSELFANIDIPGELRRGVRSGVLCLLAVLLCAMARSGEGTAFPAAEWAGVLAVSAVAVTDVHALLGLGKETIASITDFTNVILPAMTVISAATGAITGAAARQGAAALFSGLLTNLIGKVLTPAVYAFVAVNIGYGAVGNPGFKRVAAFLKWSVVTALTMTLVTFTALLGISGVMTGSADASAVKAAKLAISGAVPVVGSLLSDASESLLASIGILNATVGVFGMIVVLGICLLPFLRLGAHYLVYKIASALAATVDSGRVGELIESLGTAFGLILGMTGACGALLLVTLVACARMLSV